MLPWEAANIHPEKHNILVFLSNTLFPPFYVPFPSLFPISKNGRYLGGTFSFYLRYFFAFQSIPKRSSIEDKAKFYRRPIEHLSKTYRRRAEEGAESEQRGSRGRIWLQIYKIPKPHFHLFGLQCHLMALFSLQCHLMALFGRQCHLMSLFGSSCSSPMLRLYACTTLSKE